MIAAPVALGDQYVPYLDGLLPEVGTTFDDAFLGKQFVQNCERLCNPALVLDYEAGLLLHRSNARPRLRLNLLNTLGKAFVLEPAAVLAEQLGGSDVVGRACDITLTNFGRSPDAQALASAPFMSAVVTLTPAHRLVVDRPRKSWWAIQDLNL